MSGPVGQWLAGRQDQSPCDRGSIVVCTKRDCRLVVGPSGCDDVLVVVVVVWKGGTTCAFPFGLASERRVSLACRVPRLRHGSEVVPLLLW